MKKQLINKLVKFKCCNTERRFNSPRQFSFCECGKTAYDAGDGYYCRGIGNPADIEVIDLD